MDEAVLPGDAPPPPAPPGPPDPPPEPPPEAPPLASLDPVYRLVPPSEYQRLAPPLGGTPVPLTALDFFAAGITTSSATRLDAVAEQLRGERGLAEAPDLIPLLDDRVRAQNIPFRGNPSDVLRVDSAAGPRLFIPLGGDLMTVGNEVAVVDAGAEPALLRRVQVGVRPQRLALHPSGLVFVCNQYSNYVSILTPADGIPLGGVGAPAVIHSDFQCTDLAFAPRAAGADEQHLFVANRFRRSVLVYRVDVTADADGAPSAVSQSDAAGAPLLDASLAEITGVGASPTRLRVDEASRSLYVMNHRGGQVARVDLDTFEVTARFDAGAPAVDLVRLGGRVYVPTLMPDRGLLAPEDAGVSPLVQAAPLDVTGLDGATHEAHPGALVDDTRSYNFEDVRNGLFELDAGLGTVVAYYTDDVSAEPSFDAGQKVLAGALPQAVVRNAAGDRLYLALGGSDIVQELVVDPTALPFGVTPGRSFATRERPFALELDEAQGRLHVVAWGGDVVEIFDLVSATRIAEIDLGYALPRYPASAIEEGERWFYGAEWSNNGRKSCAHCHYDELVSDGVGFANGATAPTAVHRVKPNHDLMTTDSYFWNGSFANGSYDSLAFAAQLRTNCELVLFGMIEGPASDPALRVGDPANRFTDGQDAACRPEPSVQGALPPNFDAGAPSIASVIAAQKQVAAQRVVELTGHSPDELGRLIDLYSAGELRIPPNPLGQARAAGALAEVDLEQLERGEALFGATGCAGCHDPGNPRHPFTNGAERGTGADWTARFADAYEDDEALLARLPGGLPAVFVDAIRTDLPSPDVNVHRSPIDFFTPFCFDVGSCLAFEDPLEPDLAPEEELRRLDLLVRFNLADPLRGFVPGNVPNQVKVNVPSLRGVWTQANLLHHGHARSLREAILAPGHPALRAGERGWAIGADGALNVHGFTSGLAPDDVDALVRYVESIE